MNMSRILWYIENIWDYIVQMLPGMAAMCIVWMLCRPYRFYRLQKRGLYSSQPRETALFGFVLFCVGLAALTLFPHNFWNGVLLILKGDGKGICLTDYYPGIEQIKVRFSSFPSNLIPFQEIRRVLWGGPWLWFMLWGNIGMFIPVGFCSALLWRGATWKRTCAVGFLSSVGIELTQCFIGRVSDIDDVFLNTLGALLGFWLYCILRIIWPKMTEHFICQRKED